VKTDFFLIGFDLDFDLAIIGVDELVTINKKARLIEKNFLNIKTPPYIEILGSPYKENLAVWQP
jgi:hypothetical protein